VLAVILPHTTKPMKHKNKIIHISFIISTLSVFSVCILLPVLAFLAPHATRFLFTEIIGKILLFALVVSIIISQVFWLYCLYFMIKNDLYSKHIIPLILLNFFYAPIYYYLVKIKKIKLHNKLKEQDETIESLDNIDSTSLIRCNIFQILNLWASEVGQIKYQENVPIAQVSVELFCQWDDFYTPDHDIFINSFDANERKLLKDFNELLNLISDKTPQQLPYITDFIKTEEWKILNKKAIETISELNTIGNSKA